MPARLTSKVALYSCTLVKVLSFASGRNVRPWLRYGTIVLGVGRN